MRRTTIAAAPRSVITPEAFTVAPELLGLPLARPGRRLAAMLLDLVPVAILAGAGPTIFLAFFLAILVWRGIAASRPRGLLARGGTTIVRIAFTITAFVSVLQIGGRLRDGGDREGTPTRRADATFAAPDSVASIIARAMAAGGLNVNEVMPGLTEASPAESLTAEQRDSVLLAYAAAIRAGDTSAANRIRARAETAIAGPRAAQLQRAIDQLGNQIQALQQENEELQDELEQARRPRGIRSMIAGLADDLGIGFGWSALYFTLFLTIGRGQTPGKRLTRIRVIRLDGKPISWWQAFERFGGYFASLSTGLLGFAQILWDRNRQALHDKIVETVVIRV
jgi:uncharacterized RDD family membrane protein YckC